VTEDDTLVEFEVGTLVFVGKFSIVLSEHLAVTFHSVDFVIKLRAKRSCMHHTLMVLLILCVSGNVDNHRMVLG